MSEAANAERPLAKASLAKASLAKASLAKAPLAKAPLAKANPAAQPAGAAPDATNRIAELQVSAHLMALETGLFCVFQTPGSPQQDPATGLPGVRITPAPGLAGRPEAVSVSTFREDGWLNGTAALVRVTDGSAQILVTIYQHKGMDAAPRLQVLRLSGEPDAGDGVAGKPQDGKPQDDKARDGKSQDGKARASNVPAANGAAEAKDAQPMANPAVMAHVQRMGDVGCALGDWLGQKGSRQWVEGFGLAPLDGLAAEDLEYQAVLGRNWLSPWVESGKFCGSRGMALPLLGLKIRLKGEAAKTMECSYAATFVDGTAVGPVSGGETCEAESLAALESFQITIRPRDGKLAARSNPAAKASAPHRQAGDKPGSDKPSGAKPAVAKPEVAPAAAKPAKPTARARART
jgi:hypothetical protein